MSEKCSEHGAITVEIDNIKEDVRDGRKRLTKLEDKGDEVVEIKTILRLMREDSKKRDEMYKEHGSILANVNENLNNLNKGYDNLHNRMGAVENNQKDIKESGNINIPEMFKKLIVYGIPTVLGMIVVGGVLFYLGWK